MKTAMLTMAVLFAGATGVLAQTAGGPASAGPGAMPTATPVKPGPNSPALTPSNQGTTTTGATADHPRLAVSPGQTTGTAPPLKP